jgi:SAM-dependent methyltransferase
MTWEESVIWLKSQPDQAELVRDCFYDDPVEDAVKRYYASSEWAAVRELLGNIAPGRVLDVGAGRGISSYAFYMDGWDVTALEPDPSMLVGADAIRAMCRSLGCKIAVTGDSGEALPFPDASFDLVYARAVLHHLKDIGRFCTEVQRVLKRNGRFLFTREHVIRNEAGKQRFLERHPLHRLYGGENASTRKGYLQPLKRSGLRITRVLTPFASEINLFPLSWERVVRQARQKLKLPLSLGMVKKLLRLRSLIAPTPGNLYSFFGIK